MTDYNLSKQEVLSLKDKLIKAAKDKELLEADFKKKMAIILQLICLISHACRGKNPNIDEHFKALESLIQNSATPTEIVGKIQLITSLVEEHNIQNNTSKNTLNAAQESPQHGHQQGVQREHQQPANVNQSVIDSFAEILNKVSLSGEQDKQLQTVKRKLNSSISNDILHENFLNTLQIIIDNIAIEHSNVEQYIAYLCQTLLSVKQSISSTLLSTKGSKKTNKALNEKLQEHFDCLSNVIEETQTLAEIKIKAAKKLSSVNETFKQKQQIELANQAQLENQLTEMAKKVVELEKQSLSFEKRLQEQKEKSMLDALTHISNRAAFDIHFAKELVRFQYKPFQLSLVVLDLDNFKAINDNFGHAAGDKTLQVVANTLSTKLDNNAFVARYGGEEFVIVFSHLDKVELIKQLESIREHITRLPFTFKESRLVVSASIGATHILKEDNFHTAFERADQAMYQAKSQGKNRVIYL